MTRVGDERRPIGAAAPNPRSQPDHDPAPPLRPSDSADLGAIAEEAGHRAVAEAMVFVDHGATDLERLDSERRAEVRRSEKSTTH